jgi:hypothetical protein
MAFLQTQIDSTFEHIIVDDQKDKEDVDEIVPDIDKNNTPTSD